MSGRRIRATLAAGAVAAAACCAALPAALTPPAASAAGPPYAARPPLATPAGCQLGSAGSLLLSVPAGTTILGDVAVPVCLEGSLAIAYHGSAAAGCRRRGVCGVTGTESWVPAPPTDPYVISVGGGGTGSLVVIAARTHGHRIVSGQLLLNTESRVEGETGGGSCRSSGTTGPDGARIAIAAGTARVTLSGSPAWVGTRCAGPLDADVRSALPGLRLPLTALLQGRRTISLAGTHAFSSGGFAGSVISTLALRLGKPSGSLHASLPAPRPPARARRPAPVRVFDAPVRAVAATGRLTVRAIAESPGCRRLGACGETLSGTIQLQETRPLPGSLTRFPPQRIDPSDPDSEFPGVVTGTGRWRNAGALRVRVGGCHDASAVDSAQLLLSARGRDPKRVQVRLDLSTASYDPLRTHCPGPVLDGHGVLVGSVGVASLTGHVVTLRLNHGSAFTDAGWHVRFVGRLLVTLATGRFEADRGRIADPRAGRKTVR